MAVTYQFYFIPICSILTFWSAIACIAAKLTASHSYDYAGSGAIQAGVKLDAEFPGRDIRLASYPYYLGLNAKTIVIVTSSIALVVSAGIVALSVRAMLKCKPVWILWYHRQALLFILFANASLAFAAFVTNFVLHSKSAHFSLYNVSKDDGSTYLYRYKDGVFDLETWTCEVKSLLSFQRVSDMRVINQQCVAEKTGRACTVILFIFSIGLVMAVWWDAKKHRALTVVDRDGDRTAWEDEDDCELDDVPAMIQLEHNGLHSNRA